MTTSPPISPTAPSPPSSARQPAAFDTGRQRGRVATLGLLAVCLAACAALPPLPPRTASRALDAGTATALGARVQAERGDAAAGSSGWRLVAGGEEALASLIGLADGAERTLDLQYYALLNETSSRVLLQHVQAAAARGVRVRLLVDDFNTAGTDDALWRLAHQPGIEVRLYNPLPAGRFSVFTKVLASLGDAARINSRMHNKQLVADNALAVTGGRNLGDAYFLQAEDANFVDLDLIVAGPVVRRLSATFDRYWNSELAYPAAALIAPPAATLPPRPGPPTPSPARAGFGLASAEAAEPAPSAASGAAAAHAAAARAAVPLDAPDALPPQAAARIEARQARLERELRLTWSPVQLWSDAPSKTAAEGAPSDAEIIFDDFAALLRSAQREVLLITPYFVPGESGMALIGELRRRGVAVRILTASLAGTDAPAVYLGYARYRDRLLAMGVELYELRAVPGGPQPSRWGGVHSRTNLHAKAAAIDGATVMVGSMNFDPRSENLNTEMGLVVRSDDLGARLGRLFERITGPGAWHVVAAAGGGVRWQGRDADGRPLEFAHEPDVSVLERWALKCLSPLAPEQML